MEELEGVLRAETERTVGPAHRLLASAVARERPREHVVADDARPLRVSPPRELERVGHADAVVGLEERDIEVVADAVRGEQLLDHADERVLALCGHRLAERAIEVAEQSDVLRERDAVDRRLFVRPRGREMTEAHLRLRHPVECEVVVGKELERVAHLDERPLCAAGVQVEQPELHVRPRRSLALADRGGCRKRHCALRVAGVPDQLARIRDARIGRDVRLDRAHPVEGPECLPVPAELELGVADDAVDAGGRRRDLPRTQAECQCRAKAMPRQRQLPEPGGRDQVVRRESQDAVQDAVGLAVVRRVARLAHALQIREAERVERLRVPRVGAQLALQAGDLGLRVAGREALLQLRGDRRRQRTACVLDGAAAERAAECEDGGGQRRRRPCDQQTSSHQPVFCVSPCVSS